MLPNTLGQIHYILKQELSIDTIFLGEKYYTIYLNEQQGIEWPERKTNPVAKY